MKVTSVSLSALMVVVLTSAANGQQPAPASPADAALNACAAAAQANNETPALEEADRATKLFDDLMSTRPADALTGKARVISQCRIPFAAMLRKGALIEDSNEMLSRALAHDSAHFAARFTLALNYYHMPEFLGQTDNAVTQLEKLVVMFGNRPIPPMSMVYLFMGDVYMRKGRKADAIKAWRRGEEMFPQQKAKFEAKLLEVGASAAVQPEASASAPAQAVAPVYDIDPIIVEAGRFSVDDTRGAASLKRMDIVTMPGGTADVMQVFQAMPGVTRATEGSDLYVRGGDPAEAPVFVDGARMTYAGSFETLHGGMFGVLDPNGIKKADFSSGGFSARFGNALSGILDITSEGRPNELSWRAGANLVSAGSSLRTPLGDKAGAWVTVKATETGALLWTQGKQDLYPSTPRSLSGMAGVTFNPNANVEIKTTALTETDGATRLVDVLGYNGPLRSEGGTHMGLVSARALNNEGTRAIRGTVSAARRTTLFQVGVLDRSRNDDMFTVRVDGDMTTESGARIRAGFEGAALRAEEGGTVPVRAELAPGSESRVVEGDESGSNAGAYVETEIGVSSKVAFIAGARTDKLAALDGLTFDPRIAVAYRANGWTVRTGAGVFHQSPWRTGYRTPNPGAPSQVATRARHFVVGIERALPVFLRVEAYAKQYDGYTDRVGTLSENAIAEGPAMDRGRALGVDALVRWKASGALSGWASYSFLNGKVHLRDSNEWIASSSDVHHTFTGVAKLAFGDNWEIGTTARLATGRPFTPITGSNVDASGTRGAVYGATHSERLPDYARLDSRLTRLLPTKGGLLVFYIEGLNLLDRGNVMAYTYDASYTRRIPIDSFFASRTLVFGVEAMF